MNPEFHLTYIAAQDGNREYYELDIYADGLKKVSEPKDSVNVTKSDVSVKKIK